MNKIKMFTFSFTLGILTILNSTVSAQPIIEWEKNYGGSEWEQAYEIEHTKDGGYIIAGKSFSNDGDIKGNISDYDYWIVKINDSGNIEWEKNYGGIELDEARSIQQTTDGGYIVAGSSYSNDGDVEGNNGSSDFWIIKLDKIGNVEWGENYGGEETDFPNSIRQTSDGGYIIAGWTRIFAAIWGQDIDYWIVKLNKTGELEWEKKYGSINDEKANAVRQTNDGGYVIAGTTESNDRDVGANNEETDIWVVKLDSIGNLVWEKNYGGLNNEEVYSIQQTIDSGYIVAGTTESKDEDVTEYNGNWDCWILKLEKTGNIEWEQNYGESEWDAAISIQETDADGYVVAGVTSSNDGNLGEIMGNSDYWIFKIDTEGNLEWEKTLGGSDHDTAFSLQLTVDGGYIIAGHAYSSDGDVGENYGETDFWVVKLSPFPLGIEENTLLNKAITLYPNPVKEELKVLWPILSSKTYNNFKIYDLNGQLVLENKSQLSERIDVRSLQVGTYIIRFLNDEVSIASGRFVKIE